MLTSNNNQNLIQKNKKKFPVGKMKTVTNAIRQIARRNRLSFIPISNSLNISMLELSEYLYSRKIPDDQLLLDVIIQLREELILRQEMELKALEKLQESFKDNNDMYF